MPLFDLYPFTPRLWLDLQLQRSGAGSSWRQGIRCFRAILVQTRRKKIKKAPSGHMWCVWSHPKVCREQTTSPSAPQSIYNLSPSDPCTCWIWVGLSVAVIKNAWTGLYWLSNHSSSAANPRGLDDGDWAPDRYDPVDFVCDQVLLEVGQV